MSAKRKATITSKAEEALPLLPQAAFVVQFRADTDIAQKKIAGRVEHVVSGQFTRFTTLDELLTFIEQILLTVRGQSSEDG